MKNEIKKKIYLLQYEVDQAKDLLLTTHIRLARLNETIDNIQYIIEQLREKLVDKSGYEVVTINDIITVHDQNLKKLDVERLIYQTRIDTLKYDILVSENRIKTLEKLLE